MMLEILNEHLYFYQKYLKSTWANLGPTEYICILMIVGVSGWYMMRKGPSQNVDVHLGREPKAEDARF